MKEKKEKGISYWDETGAIVIRDFEKYVDENLDPLLDSDGNLLYEVEMLRRNVSDDARTIGRLLFLKAVENAKVKPVD